MTRLCDIATSYKADKAPWCWGYTEIYDGWLAGRSVKTVMEIGVWLGHSLRMWRDYFSDAMVYGVDNDKKWTVKGEARIKTFLCDAYDPTAMTPVMSEVGPVDFFVDDAVHYLKEQTSLLTFMWPHIRSGGTYAIEETMDNAREALRATTNRLEAVAKFRIIYAQEGYSLTLLRKA